MKIKPIGIIHTPYKKKEGMPIQARKSNEKGRIEVFKEYAAGLKDIDGFSHITVLYRFHKNKGYSLLVKPFLDDNKRGVFATRSPNRPNKIGMSTLKLVKRKKNVLIVKGVDMLDGTPLLDIKPYVPAFDYRKSIKIGWLKGKIK